MIGYQYGKDSAILSAGDYALCPAKYFFMACDKSLLTRRVRSRWLDVGQVSVFACLWSKTDLALGY